MPAQIAVIITPADLQKMIDEAVAKRTAEIRAAFETTNKLPARMTVKAAAAHLGIDASTFHRKYSHLKQREGNSVFVLGRDLG